MIGRLLSLMFALAAPATAADRTADLLQAAGFEGAVLVGEPDGRSAIQVISGATPLAPDAVWRWASITKQLTATIAMQEVAAGRLDLDKPVSAYWPQWKAPNSATIRIRDLLRHQSGLPDPGGSPADPNGIPAFHGSAAAAPTISANAFCAGPARAAPGGDFLYNNCDFIVLGEVLKQITGKSFERLAKERLARPTGMRRFGVYQTGTPRPPHVAATGEDKVLDLVLDLGLHGPAGSAYGSIEDLWRFDRALMSGKLLDSASRAAMWAGEPKLGYAAFGQWVSPVKLARCNRTVTVVDRQGLVGGIELRNYLLPEQNRALILFARKKPTNYGEPWQGKGLAYELLEEIGCR